MDITVGVFAGLITYDGKLVLQQRTEKGSRVFPGQSFRGDYELPGGGVEKKDLSMVLTSGGLVAEMIREVKEELGLSVIAPPWISIYRTVLVREGQLDDWAIMIPVPPGVWNQDAKRKRRTVEVDADDLWRLGLKPKGEQLLSGWGKRMYRMSLAALIILSPHTVRATTLLSLAKPDWRKEYFHDAQAGLRKMRNTLDLE